MTRASGRSMTPPSCTRINPQCFHQRCDRGARSSADTASKTRSICRQPEECLTVSLRNLASISAALMGFSKCPLAPKISAWYFSPVTVSISTRVGILRRIKRLKFRVPDEFDLFRHRGHSRIPDRLHVVAARIAKIVEEPSRAAVKTTLYCADITDGHCRALFCLMTLS